MEEARKEVQRKAMRGGTTADLGVVIGYATYDINRLCRDSVQAL